MIDASKKHSYIPYKSTMVKKYFNKYDFTKAADSMEEICSSGQAHDGVTRDQRKQLIAASIIATEFNDGEYIKAEGRSDIVDNEYVKLNFSNKDLTIITPDRSTTVPIKYNEKLEHLFFINNGITYDFSISYVDLLSKIILKSQNGNIIYLERQNNLSSK